MTEQEKEESVQDVQVQEEVQQEQTQEVEAQPEIQEKSKTEINWERAAQTLQAQKQKIDELEAEIHKIKSVPVSVPQEGDELGTLDPADYATVGITEKLIKKEALAAAKKIVEQYAQQQTFVSDEQRAREKYEDYDYIVDNFAVPLIKTDPALAHKIASSPNPALTAYRLGKLSDAYEETMGKQETSPKAEKIIKNSKRPTSVNAASSGLKDKANEFANLTKQQIWEKSQQFAKRA